MANFITNAWDRIIGSVANSLSDAVTMELYNKAQPIQRAKEYREGMQDKQLDVKPMQADDNIIVNFSRLIIDRSVASIVGDGVIFDLPGDAESAEQEHIDGVWALNKKEVLLKMLLIAAADGGTGFYKIIPDGIIGKDGKVYPRIVNLNPEYVSIETDQFDKDMVTAYVIQYMFMVGDKPKIYRETHSLEISEGENAPSTWRVLAEVFTPGVKTPDSSEELPWEYDFPAVGHWQNLANPYSIYGKKELTDDVIELQNKINYTASNISKVIRYYGHPQRYIKGGGGFNRDKNGQIETGPDKMPILGANTTIEQLSSVERLDSAMEFYTSLRQAFFDIERTVDIDSIQDKLGSLTNFGLRVLYSDAIQKINEKRLLFGEALKEINERLLIIGGFGNTDPGLVIWPDPLPVNESEEIQVLKQEIELGIVSKETASTERGRDWMDEEEKIAAERQAERLAQGNIGAALLGAFTAGE